MAYLIKRKYTAALSFALRIRTLRKLQLDAERRNMKPALIVELSGGMMFLPEKWVCIPYDDFRHMELH